ncbi:hypothetical protein BDV96DRAFT_311532 [Lophiotrema nucula]|uniref:Heterokaryon incompatibility domain-containing protein n=1 Tax=Lophiotrema nucula TaxID=690887 RepID=A0A6A5YKV3_9PLEO|nr:hypothetical protein BDV96DRAFT_311532 [Lophiotrema nucula]
MGLIDLLSRSWFKRVWILQEVANAKDGIICCGDRTISSRTFVFVQNLVPLEPENPRSLAVLEIMPGSLRETSWWHQKKDLYTLLDMFGRKSEASDARDIIYALLGIASDGAKASTTGLRPDYSKSIQQLIQDATLFLFGVSRSYRTMSDFLGDFEALNINGLAKMAATSSSEDLARYIDSRRNKIAITATTLKAAASNTKYGDGAIHLLCMQGGVRVTRAIITTAMQNASCGQSILRSLITHPNKDIKVRAGRLMKEVIDDMASESERNVWQKVLAQHGGQAAILSALEKQEAIQRLTHFSDPRRSRVTSLRSSYNVVSTSVRSRGSKHEVGMDLSNLETIHESLSPGEAIIAAVKSDEYADNRISLILDSTSENLEITEDMLKAAATNKLHGASILERLFKYGGMGVRVSQELLVWAIFDDDCCGKQTLAILLGHRGSDVHISADFVASAIGIDGCEWILPLLLKEFEAEAEAETESAESTKKKCVTLFSRMVEDRITQTFDWRWSFKVECRELGIIEYSKALFGIVKQKKSRS